MVLVCDLNKFRALCTCGTRLTSARRLPHPWIWVLGHDRFSAKRFRTVVRRVMGLYKGRF
ncbi:hypothetical protein SLEP1_g3768 [Rubroshorea leprosula]|uniref:Uncharacterized protein n=1 Tax=Rubroshorea leprosula TaxID=152421 RepID=A0AAV5HVW5_9ROSI|nr:hypothetical protein SLEP1_g3768 [Rubroshorea leprosula]